MYSKPNCTLVGKALIGTGGQIPISAITATREALLLCLTLWQILGWSQIFVVLKMLTNYTTTTKNVARLKFFGVGVVLD